MRPLLHKKLGGKLRRPAFNTPMMTAPVTTFSFFKETEFFCPTVFNLHSLEGFLKLGLAAAKFLYVFFFASVAVNGAQRG